MGDIFRERDEQFEAFLEKKISRFDNAELTEEKRKERRSRCDVDDFEFCREYYPEIFTDAWSPLHEHIRDLKSGEHAVSGFRFAGKSAMVLFAKLIKRIALGGIGLTGLALRNEEDAKERTSLIYKRIRRNKKLCYDYSIQFQQVKKGHYIINNKTFVALGMREGLRNWFDENMERFELIICDDLYNRQSVASEKDNLKVYNFVTAECSGQLKPGGLLIWLFNLIAPNSPGCKFMEERPDACYNFPAMNEHDETNWPNSRWTTEALLEKKRSIPLQVWLGDWMNQPVLIGEVFQQSWLRYVDTRLLDIQISIGVMDPSFGKSPSACLKGGVVMGLTSDNKSHILDLYGRKEDFVFVFDWWHKVRSTYPGFRAILWENDFAQWTHAAPYYEDWIRQTGLRLPIIPILSSSLITENYGADKIGRIMNLVHPHQVGDITISEAIKNTEDHNLWRTQYISFGKTKDKLDIIDAEATAYIMLPTYANTDGIRTLKSRRFKRSRESASWLTGR